VRGIRCLGSCALNLCGVAMGRLDAFYEVGFGGPWDVAAAALILEEAGGQVPPPHLPFLPSPSRPPGESQADAVRSLTGRCCSESDRQTLLGV